MYDNYLAQARIARPALISAALAALLMALATAGSSAVRAQDYESASVIRKISERSEKLEMTTNSSRILTPLRTCRSPPRRPASRR
jgi:hypothetical protein